MECEMIGSAQSVSDVLKEGVSRNS